MYVILLAFLKGGCRSLPYRDLPLRHIHCWWWTERCTSTQADIVWCCVHEFLSTLSAWRATKVCWYRYLRQRHFYPRSPHGERLGLYSFDFTLLIDFYPRSPHGERPHHNYIIFIAYVFLSTLSAWRATSNWQRIQGVSHISIHALRMESDLAANRLTNYRIKISIHALRMESDIYDKAAERGRSDISIHALRMESDLLDKLQHIRRKKRISIHALRMESDAAICTVT